MEMATNTMHPLEDDCLRSSTITSSRTFQGHRHDSAEARPSPPRWNCVRHSLRVLTVDLVTCTWPDQLSEHDVNV